MTRPYWKPGTTYTIVDSTPKIDPVMVEKEKVVSDAEIYLASTDWMIIRQLDNGTMCPEDVKSAREQARKVIKNK